MKVVEITEKKLGKMSELVEDMLLAGGELMHCLSKLEDEYYGERRSDRDRMDGMGGGRYGERHHDRDYEDWDDPDEMRRMIGERRRRRGMRY